MLIFALFLLVGIAFSIYIHYRIGTRPAGSSNVVDRDADRIAHELRAILAASEHR